MSPIGPVWTQEAQGQETDTVWLLTASGSDLGEDQE